MRKRKIIKATFADGVRELPSSLKIKCNATGQVKGFYTPYLIKLIARKYNNNYDQFISTYVSKGQSKIRSSSEESQIEEPDLSLYKNALKLEYKFLRTQPVVNKHQHRINLIKEKFNNRFPLESISDY